MNDPTQSPPEATPLAPPQIAAAIAWVVLVALAGLAIGWLIGATRVGVYGNLALLPLGLCAGVVTRQITGRMVEWIGWMLVVALFVAFFLTLVGWLRFGGFVGGDTWGGALGLLPKVNLTTMVPGAVCAGFGSYSAWEAMKKPMLRFACGAVAILSLLFVAFSFKYAGKIDQGHDQLVIAEDADIEAIRGMIRADHLVVRGVSLAYFLFAGIVLLVSTARSESLAWRIALAVAGVGCLGMCVWAWLLGSRIRFDQVFLVWVAFPLLLGSLALAGWLTSWQSRHDAGDDSDQPAAAESESP